MKRNSPFRTLVLPLIAAAAMNHTLASGAPTKPPNIVFIYADDMGWTGSSVEMIQGDSASKSDFYQTPNLEKLAARGMVFSQAYSPGPMCTPSRASVLTGRTPATLHITTPGRGRTEGERKLNTPTPTTRLPDNLPTIGTTLKAAGYATALLGKWHIGRFDHAGKYGFDLHDGETQNDCRGTDQDPKEIFSLTRRGIDFMEKHVKEGKPFFLQVSHYAVHTPVQGRPDSIRKFRDLPAGSTHADAGYGGMTWDLDASLAQLVSALERLGIADNTYLVFMSDNGAAGNRRRPNNRPLFAGKGTLYEGGIRVPLIVAGPGIKSGYCTTPVSGTDLFATFAAWTGVSAATKESADLTPLLMGRQEAFKRSVDLLFHYPHYGHGLQTPQTALVVGDWKLLRDWESGKDQLFNLKQDLGEAADLSAEKQDLFKSMVKSMNLRLKQSQAQLPDKNPDYNPASEPQLRRRRTR